MASRSSEVRYERRCVKGSLGASRSLEPWRRFGAGDPPSVGFCSSQTGLSWVWGELSNVCLFVCLFVCWFCFLLLLPRAIKSSQALPATAVVVCSQNLWFWVSFSAVCVGLGRAPLGLPENRARGEPELLLLCFLLFFVFCLLFFVLLRKSRKVKKR